VECRLLRMGSSPEHVFLDKNISGP
jgi:hypothetical protein